MRKIVRLMAILLITILVIKCSHSTIPIHLRSQMYPGPNLPKDQIAIIKGEHNEASYFLTHRSSHSTIHMIDGQLVRIKWEKDLGGPKEVEVYDVDQVEVLPGPHEVVARINLNEVDTAGCFGGEYTRLRLLVFNFEAKAGHIYTVEPPKITFVGASGIITISIFDESTKEVVAVKVVDTRSFSFIKGKW